ncbi:hypothetical protein ACJIZ3_000007 [Penstemon smallii]|uniref:Uncharacterized protein n=1 Tax=Penstemon smallii TaxID=265156 RepID=A0ABD3RG11_9LAMI
MTFGLFRDEFAVILDDCCPKMNTLLNRKKELSSAMAAANKTPDLKRKAMLSSVLAAANPMANSTIEPSWPRSSTGNSFNHISIRCNCLYSC